MTTYNKDMAQAEIHKAQQALEQASAYVADIDNTGGDASPVVTPKQFEDSYRALSRRINIHGDDNYDKWTPASQASHRSYARVVLEGAGFTVRET